MKKIFFIASAIVFSACGTNKNVAEVANTEDHAAKYAATITAKELGTHLFTYASDEFEGRNTGEPGQKKAIAYLKDFYISQGIASAIGGDDYFQEVPAEFLNKRKRQEPLKDSENVVAFIKGTEKPNEIVVISAHLDHEGIKNGKIYNGADDDGSGTVAILEIAQAFQMATKAGKGPKRSILFLHVTGEEKGLLGSQYYTENPIFPIANTVCDLNIDMIGRTDERHKSDPNYVYLIGSDKLSTELHKLSEEINKKYTNINLDYKYNDENDPNRFYYRSDHYNFAKFNVPIIFYFNGTHVDYHKPTDTPDKINYELLENRAKLVFHTAWQVANRENRIVADKAIK
ncbi:MAG: M28 family peptidase [Flavobacteriia bacterium]|nr:M28 family peptidase [Flavobacteriia bacterium]OIP46904.1 MAG: peptidase M28 [Flavobacteriaceae bacterium CG2_30_31_66]PIV97034.1 MAG: peptidase M28 [Flavobacteriaceae bacterium CG17_big_fil_post_rev_8_21_14_2_50_31_13]PIX14498.1 MAG: peptidase M28 [Flavobacteriaceae bacterium CG_4_8_14_3_um_filter_31_8]PIY16339.1 MAG: peptidase M28 [Flavobacteriaceae bacterium CG_4_10_14_3_um_filter_31_253]PIZ12214.1 MAG: peptidase M28 [Flavobacteriaceae bacterium CG_4_10_14_0_8_um_filter_31_99]PJC11274.1